MWIYTDRYIERTPEPNRTHLLSIVRAKRLAGVRESSISAHVEKIAVFMRDVNQDVATLTKEQIEDWYLQARGRYTPATLSSYVISIGMLIKHIHGVEEGKRMMSSIHVQRPLTTVREEELLTDEEIKRMMQLATHERDRALLALMYSSGARISEILGANIGDVTIDRVGASLHVNGKTGERDIDMFVGVPELRAWLNVHPMRGDDSAPLFVTYHARGVANRRLSARSVQCLLIRLAKAAGIDSNKRFNPHSFRHKRATDVAEFLTTSDMREMFGWAAGSSMPNVYVHSSRRKVRQKLAERAGIHVPEAQAPTTMVRQCPTCGCINGATDLYCANCYAILDDEFGKNLRVFKKYMEDEVKKLLEKQKNE